MFSNIKFKKEEEEQKAINPHPIVKLDKTQRELRINKNNLKLKGDHDNDVQKLVELGNQS
jgi:hypothetical protein